MLREDVCNVHRLYSDKFSKAVRYSELGQDAGCTTACYPCSPGVALAATPGGAVFYVKSTNWSV